jgi:hypothetical protein
MDGGNAGGIVTSRLNFHLLLFILIITLEVGFK